MEGIGQVAARVAALTETVAQLPPTGALRDAFAALRREDVTASSRLAGAELDRTEVRALLERGRALGGHALGDYLIVAGYARAEAWAVTHASRKRPILADDLRTLHRLAVAGLHDDGGAWRTRNFPPLVDGTVPPPHWLVGFETVTMVGRLVTGEADPAPLALARAIARIARLRPFAYGNGRVARLTANLLAYRRGLPPLALDARAQRAYGGALAAADAGDIAPLARLVGRALVRGLERLRDAAEAPAPLLPLGAFADTHGTQALYKAAQRGRLRVVRRDGRLYATHAWVAAYRGGLTQDSPEP